MLKKHLRKNVDQPEEVTGTQDLNKGGHSRLEKKQKNNGFKYAGLSRKSNKGAYYR
jgi:hypothetical protein